MSRSSRRTRQRGAASLELVGLLPVLLLCTLIALQLGVVGWTAVATGQAAKDGARAAGLHRDTRAAVSGSLPGSLSAKRVEDVATGNGRRVTVEVKIPSVLRVIDLGSVTREAEMPVIP